jgi:hypothetical protein
MCKTIFNQSIFQINIKKVLFSLKKKKREEEEEEASFSKFGQPMAPPLIGGFWSSPISHNILFP